MSDPWYLSRWELRRQDAINRSVPGLACDPDTWVRSNRRGFFWLDCHWDWDDKQVRVQVLMNTN